MSENNTLRLYPLPPRETNPKAIYKDLALPPVAACDPSRPYVLINMVSSLDGRTAVEGKASHIGSDSDRQVMRTLRSKVDAVMIGANTLRAEKLSLGLDEPAGSQPMAVILTNTGDVPLEDHLIRHEGQEVLVLVPEGCPEEAVRLLLRSFLQLETVPTVRRIPATACGAIDLEEALEVLKAEHGVNHLLVEGGPTLNHALISRNLADELFLTLAPILLGGTSNDAPAILDGQPLLRAAPTEGLLSVYVAGNELFLRYKVNSVNNAGL